jgi:hypothetical protein
MGHLRTTTTVTPSGSCMPRFGIDRRLGLQMLQRMLLMASFGLLAAVINLIGFLAIAAAGTLASLDRRRHDLEHSQEDMIALTN